MPTIHDAHAAMFGLARHGELYERWAGRLAGRLYARVTADLLNAALPPGARILDVGTGPGLLPLRIAAACPQWTIDAIDLSPQMIDRARQSAIAAGRPKPSPSPSPTPPLCPSRTPRSTSSCPPSASTTGPTPAPDCAS